MMLARPIARREARALFDLAAGFVYAQTLSAAIRVELFHHLAALPRSANELARAIGLTEDATLRLLVAAEPLGLVERRSRDRWGLGRRGAAVLGNPGLVAMIAHHDVLYREIADPVALLTRGSGSEMAAFWPYARSGAPGGLGAAAVQDYSALMAASQGFFAHEVLAAYSFGRHRQLTDIGGGTGVFALAAAQRHPRLNVVVFDLPEVAALATAEIRRVRLGERVRAVGGDMFAGELPAGSDAAILVRVLHDHDDAAALTLLGRIYATLPPGGTIVVAEPMAGTRAAPGIAPYFTFYLTAMGSGRPRTAAEILRLLSSAGFASARLRRDRNPTVTRVITAVRS